MHDATGVVLVGIVHPTQAELTVPQDAAARGLRRSYQRTGRDRRGARPRHHGDIAHAAERHRVAAAVGAGWDPGLLPQLQRLFDSTVFTARLMVDAARALALQGHRAWRYTPFGLVPLPSPERDHAPPARSARHHIASAAHSSR